MLLEMHISKLDNDKIYMTVTMNLQVFDKREDNENPTLRWTKVIQYL